MRRRSIRWNIGGGRTRLNIYLTEKINMNTRKETIKEEGGEEDGEEGKGKSKESEEYT